MQVSCSIYCHLKIVEGFIYSVTSHMQMKVVDGPQHDSHTWAALHRYMFIYTLLHCAGELHR